jgi:hypothetical protein
VIDVEGVEDVEVEDVEDVEVVEELVLEEPVPSTLPVDESVRGEFTISINLLRSFDVGCVFGGVPVRGRRLSGEIGETGKDGGGVDD